MFRPGRCNCVTFPHWDLGCMYPWWLSWLVGKLPSIRDVEICGNAGSWTLISQGINICWWIFKYSFFFFSILSCRILVLNKSSNVSRVKSLVLIPLNHIEIFLVTLEDFGCIPERVQQIFWWLYCAGVLVKNCANTQTLNKLIKFKVFLM